MTNSTNYQDFLKSKLATVEPSGFECNDLPDYLFDYQRYIVKLALQKGKFAIFAGTGLGKTAMQLTWAVKVAEYTKRPVLILAPLAVAKQTAYDESAKFGIECQYCESQDDVINGVNITNYQKLDKFDVSVFSGIVLDESSILKSFTGAIRNQLIEYFAKTPYRLACSATPSPNDHMELGNHAEFLGIMSRTEMLAQYFIHDSSDTSKWRLKKHANNPFWKWLAQWSIMLQKPSDIGFSDDDYKLPQLNEFFLEIKSGIKRDGELFAMAAKGLTEQRQAKKQTLEKRVAKLAAMINESTEQWLVWCETNDESALLKKMIDGSVEVKGSDSDRHKEQSVFLFTHYKELMKWHGNQSTPKTDVAKQNQIQTLELSAIANHAKTLKNAKNTSVNGTKKTKKKYNNKTQSISQSKTSSEKQDTQQTQTIENSKKQNQENTNKTIQKNDLLKDLKNTTLPQISIETCTDNKTEFVPSAQSQLQKIQEQQSPVKNCMSTTVMQQDECEDSSVQAATWESANFPTTRYFSKKQPVTFESIKKARVLISKPSIFGFGLNMQNCRNVAFAGLSNSFEMTYQAIRRCYRFGQEHAVNVYYCMTDTDTEIKLNLERKKQQFEEMLENLLEHMKEHTSASTSAQKNDYVRKVEKGDNWESHLCDCVELASEIKTGTIDFSVFSPPFSSLYTYSNSERDMGNCQGYNEFFIHFQFLIKELYRIIRPGRLVSFHCMNLPTSKQNHGFIGIRDFRGDLIRAFEKEGFIFHSEVTIWKNPVVAMQRTKALGLLHKQLCKDSAMSRQGIPDYLVTMRKPGDNESPVSGHLVEYYGENGTEPSGDSEVHKSINIWQRYASPVWMDIDQSDVLNYREGRANEDEKHICPLQLGVIRRALQLWSNPGDLVYSPFSGIGSEGYVALDMGRRFIGSELKESYWNVGLKNLRHIENKPTQLSLV